MADGARLLLLLALLGMLICWDDGGRIAKAGRGMGKRREVSKQSYAFFRRET